MKKSNQHFKIRWIKKYIREPREIDNLKHLLKLNLELIPHIRNITNEYYYIEKCKTIESKDFDSLNFHKLYFNLLVPLHKFKNESFTPGIYKYFGPQNLNYKVNNQKYIPYIFSKFEKLIQSASFQFPNLIEDKTFITLLKHLKNMKENFKNWKPIDGYSLLHGDLHIGNIVKRNNNFLLIDFEYLRYGTAELEIANLIISCLLWNYKNKINKKELMQLNTEYFKIYSNLSLLDDALLKLFFIFSLSLFYFSLYLRGKHNELEVVREITKQYLN